MNEIEQKLWANVYATEYERLCRQQSAPGGATTVDGWVVNDFRQQAINVAQSAVRDLRVASCKGHVYEPIPEVRVLGYSRCKHCGHVKEPT
jgi:hypothetical protein